MRPKEDKLGVADGIIFEGAEEVSETSEPKKEPKKATPKKQTPKKTPKKEAEEQVVSASGRTYSKYYTPKPKKGARGGTLGRGPVNEKDRIIQFSVSCTAKQKERYKKAAAKEGTRFPDFINNAIQEYIENHDL